MSINNSFALNQDQLSGYGKLFGSIDFLPRTGVVRAEIRNVGLNTKAGTLSLGNSEYELTISEIDRLVETLTAGKDAFLKMYVMGL